MEHIKKRLWGNLLPTILVKVNYVEDFCMNAVVAEVFLNQVSFYVNSYMVFIFPKGEEGLVSSDFFLTRGRKPCCLNADIPRIHYRTTDSQNTLS